MRQRWTDYRVFWRQFRDAYNSTGAVLPSGRALSAALARFVRDGTAAEAAAPNGAAPVSGGKHRARRILEVGPGTGAVTDQIIRALRPSDQLVLVERNEQFVAHLRARIESDSIAEAARDRISLVHASVEELPEDEPFDLIISGLPLNNFSVDLVDQILSKMRRLLAPGGTLSFFEYVAIRRAKSLISSAAEKKRLRGIERVFNDVVAAKEIRRDLVLANVPPAWVHHVRFGG